MKVSIRDRDILASIRPSDLLAYVRSTDWRQTEELRNQTLLFERISNGTSAEIMVPLSSTSSDYALRVGEIFSALADIEQRSQEEILRDVLTSSSDLIRIRSISPTARDGSISMGAGVALFEQARELLLAAASATVAPRAYWPRRRPAQAIQYLDEVRLGQTERGSFVLTIQSPVPPVLRVPGMLFEEEPFGRKVVQTLVRSLRAVQGAAREAMATEDLASFRRAVPQGVSANFCDALVGLASSSAGGSVDLSLTFAPTRPPSHGDLHISMNISQDVVPVIGEAARLFKETAPEEDFSAIGFVERLDRVLGATQGQITVRTLVDQTLRKVTLELGEELYQQAVRAHAANLAVYFDGELVKEGRIYRVPAVQSFFVLDNNNEPETARELIANDRPPED
jgi:hypothetical protein